METSGQPVSKAYSDALVVHEWTGLGDYAKTPARKLAELGYVAFAADIYGKGIRPKPQEAAAQAGIYKKDRPTDGRGYKPH